MLTFPKLSVSSEIPFVGVFWPQLFGTPQVRRLRPPLVLRLEKRFDEADCFFAFCHYPYIAFAAASRSAK